MAKQIKTSVKAGEEYEFLDTEGKHLFSIWINPSDVGMVQRAQDLVDYLNNLDLSVNHSEEDSEKEPTLEEVSVVLKENTKILGEKLDGLFNAEISPAIFSVMSPFTPLASGKLYIEEVVEKMLDAITAETNARFKKVQSRQNKYTAKYHG